MTSAALARSSAVWIAGSSSIRGRSPIPTGVSGQQLVTDEVLEARGALATPLDEIEISEVDTVDVDVSDGRLVHPREELDERGLARAVLADERDGRSGGKVQVDIGQHGSVGARVLERHVDEVDP